MEELVGIYYGLLSRTRFYSKACQLEISELSEGKYHFNLEIINSAQSGSVGTTWGGYCEMKDNSLLFNVKQTIDWKNLAVSDEPEETISDKFQIIEAQVFQDDEILKIKIQLPLQEIFVCKMPQDIDRIELSSIEYWIVQSIVKTHELNPDSNIHANVPKWIISNLLFKDIYQDSEDEEKFDLELEYDFYDEKPKMVDKNEPISKHVKAIAVLNEKFKVIEFKIKG